MKTKRRHELQTNVLADWIGHQVEFMRPYFKAMIVVLVATVVVGLVAAWVVSDKAARAGAGWEDYFSAMAERDANRLRTVAEDHAGTLTALWAKQSEGDIELGQGMESLLIDRNLAKESLRRAKNCFSDVAEAAARHPALQQRARFGLAQVHEALSELEKAREYYEMVASTNPGSPLTDQARKRVETLKDPAVEKWYNWFSRQKPKPPSSTSADGSASPKLPGDLGTLSDRPDIKVPSGPSTPSQPASASKTPAPGAGSKPAEK